MIIFLTTIVLVQLIVIIVQRSIIYTNLCDIAELHNRLHRQIGHDDNGY